MVMWGNQRLYTGDRPRPKKKPVFCQRSGSFSLSRRSHSHQDGGFCLFPLTRTVTT